MSISASDVKDLREKTGAGIMDCKRALGDTNGDVEAAITFLREKGLATAAKKSGRTTAEGTVISYIHAGGKVGVLLELNCETDFVAKTEDFQDLAKDVAMHVAAMGPQYVSRDEVSEDEIAKERDIFTVQAKESGKPENIIPKIVDGKVDKYLKEICLMDQPFCKDPDITIGKLITEAVSKLGENIQIRRFEKFTLGEGIEKKEADFAKEVAEAAAIK